MRAGEERDPVGVIAPAGFSFLNCEGKGKGKGAGEAGCAGGARSAARPSG